jgi:hypothetical protein
LSTKGSSQNKAMEHITMTENLHYYLPDLNYKFLQTYALLTLFYETLWSQLESDELQISIDEVCSWQILSKYYVTCQSAGEIVALDLSNSRLNGNLPPELSILDQSLSKLLGA